MGCCTSSSHVSSKPRSGTNPTSSKATSGAAYKAGNVKNVDPSLLTMISFPLSLEKQTTPLAKDYIILSKLGEGKKCSCTLS